VTYGIEARIADDRRMLLPGLTDEQSILLTFSGDLLEPDVPVGTEVWYPEQAGVA
jgi:hypothetical protein